MTAPKRGAAQPDPCKHTNRHTSWVCSDCGVPLTFLPTAAPAPVPSQPTQDWKMMPIEPTEEMLRVADNMMPGAYAALLAAAPAVEDAPRALEAFTAYFVANYPGPDTLIHDPKWHAPKIFRAAQCAIRDAQNIPTGNPSDPDYQCDVLLAGEDATPRTPLHELEARLDEAKWWEHLVGALNEGQECKGDCIYCARISGYESKIAALAWPKEQK